MSENSGRVGEGDFAATLAPIKRPLYNFIKKSLNFNEAADDVYQDTLLRGYRYFATWDRKRSFKNWIFTIAHNQIRDYYRRDVGVWNAGEWSDSLSAVKENLLVREVYHAAARLPERKREVFFLYYDCEFKVAEIAAVLNVSQASVKFILVQVRRFLRQTLEVDK